MPPPHLIFGTATLGGPPPGFSTPSSVHSLLTTLSSLSITRLDTAARYPPTDPGRSEELLREAFALALAAPTSSTVTGTPADAASFQIDTKCYTDTATDGSGDLEKERMEESVAKSLDRLGRGSKSVGVVYAHRADPATPLEEQVRNFNALVERGACKAWGVSNFPLATMQALLAICDEKGLQKPKYYQGVYNLIARGMEEKLLPLLRAHGINFVGYAPLAAGFLTTTSTLNPSQTHTTRLSPTNPIGRALAPRFASPVLDAAIRAFAAELARLGFDPVDVALRWLVHHSPLREADGIVLGASSEAQVVKSVQAIRRGRLDGDGEGEGGVEGKGKGSEVLRAVERLWSEVEGEGMASVWGNLV